MSRSKGEKQLLTPIFFTMLSLKITVGCVCNVENCDLYIESSFNNPLTGKEDWETEKEDLGIN